MHTGIEYASNHWTRWLKLCLRICVPNVGYHDGCLRGETEMPRPPELSSHDLDADTWHRPSQSDQSTTSQEPPVKDCTPRSSHADIGVDVDTPIPLVAPTPFNSPDSKDSSDSDESTPKPGPDRSDEWDLFPPPTIEQGQVILGKYLLEKKIGEGGMGEVWLVENIQLERKIALKLIKPEIAQNDKGWRRFDARRG